MQQDQQRHPRPAQPTIDRHFLARRDRESNGLRVAVEQIHIARSASQRSWYVNSIADVLHSVRSIACDHSACGLVIESERRNPVILTVKHPRLAIRSRRRQSAEPASQRKSFAQQPRNRRAQSELQRSPKIRVRERVDLQHDQSALRWTRTFLARERPVPGSVVPAQERTRARSRASLRYARWCSIRRKSSLIGTGLRKTSPQPASRHFWRVRESP